LIGENLMKVYVLVICAAALASAVLMSGCATPPESISPPGPLAVLPIERPQNIERINSGSIFQPNMATVSLFSGDRKPRFVGDTLKINISETLNATNAVNTDTSKATTLASKGPGAKAGLGIFSSIFNLDANAAGGATFKGNGTTNNTNTFTGQVAATVVNVMSNGNLVVAGERSISVNGGSNVLRFSGIVNPRDIQAGNIVASADTVNAKLEVVGRGEVSEASQRNWIQRVLADSLSFW
jgi:flagellar L-ring protein precursor FlgH